MTLASLMEEKWNTIAPKLQTQIPTPNLDPSPSSTPKPTSGGVSATDSDLKKSSGSNDPFNSSDPKSYRNTISVASGKAKKSFLDNLLAGKKCHEQ